MDDAVAKINTELLSTARTSQGRPNQDQVLARYWTGGRRMILRSSEKATGRAQVMRCRARSNTAAMRLAGCRVLGVVFGQLLQPIEAARADMVPSR